MKYIYLRLHTILLMGILVAAVVLRILLVANSWPLLNSDEGIMGMMAMHIQHGERPIFFYNQPYMGVLEAYLGALIFNQIGISLFALRLGLILLFLGFLISMYLLARLLYTRNLALFTVLLLALGSNAVLSRELNAIGGYMETILCSALAFLLATWLAFAASNAKRRRRGWRLAGYLAWGLVIGVGLWSDLLILPSACCTLLILLIFCRRDLFRGAWLPLLIGLVLGMFPLLFYNLHAAPGSDSWSNLINQQGSEPLSVLPWQLLNTINVSLPTITGSPFCRSSELPALHYFGFEPSVAPTPLCHFLGQGWSLAYLFLLTASGCAALIFLWRYWRNRSHGQEEAVKDRWECICQTVRFLLIVSTTGTTVIYIHSRSPLTGPSLFSRYLICLWLALPALLWPLWIGATRASWRIKQQTIPWLMLMTKVFCLCSLLLLPGIALFATSVAVREIPEARAAEAQENALIAGLLDRGITHFYTEYWTCYRAAFQSQERVTCSVIDLNKCLMPPIIGPNNRYMPYTVAVSEDRFAAYVVPRGSPCIPVVIYHLQQEKQAYRHFNLQGYSIYQPFKTSA